MPNDQFPNQLALKKTFDQKRTKGILRGPDDYAGNQNKEVISRCRKSSIDER